MAKVYTAQEMREVASIYDEAGEDIVAAMLRQSADLMEREITETNKLRKVVAAKDALIKELADALNDVKEEFEIRKNYEFDDDVVVEYCDKNIIRIGALVAKAREVVK